MKLDDIYQAHRGMEHSSHLKPTSVVYGEFFNISTNDTNRTLTSKDEKESSLAFQVGLAVTLSLLTFATTLSNVNRTNNTSILFATTEFNHSGL